MYSLKKTERLKSKKLIELLFSKGNKVYEFPVKAVWLSSEIVQENPLQIGFAVSKRFHKKAADRNRIKRLMREAYRLNKINLAKLITESNSRVAIMLIYTGNNLTSFKEVEDKIIVILNRLEKELKSLQ